MPDLESDDEGNNLPLPPLETDEDWRQAILNFKGKRLLVAHVSPEYSPIAL